MNYGDVALGVECALPESTQPARRSGIVRRLVDWLITALRTRA